LGDDSLEIYREVDEIIGREWLVLATLRDPLVGLDAVVVQHVEQQFLAATKKPQASAMAAL
jgi:hypothetical protein